VSAHSLTRDPLADAERVTSSDVRGIALAKLEGVIDEHVGGLTGARGAHDRAYARALPLLDDQAPDVPRAELALDVFARDMLCELVVDLAARPPDLRTLVRHLDSDTEISVLELGRELLRAPRLLQLSPALAVEVDLTLVLAFADARAVSLWRPSSTGEPECVAYVGDAKAEGLRTRQVARRALADEVVKDRRGSNLDAVTIEWSQGPAALVVCGGRGLAARRRVLLEAAVPSLAAALEREHLLKLSHDDQRSRNGGSEQPSAAERRLARVRFDLHDGPQQDLMLLAEDLRLFRSQLASVLDADGNRERLLGRIDDLEARLIALDGDLRRISVSTESPFLQREALPDAVGHVVAAFAERTEIQPEVTFGGDFTELSDSQHITLLGLIRESLSNIREHSDARHVTITLCSTENGVAATITDDGRGFDPETALVRAARSGHLGLVGMYERVRMLGGDTRIDSRPGGPTVISVRLPPAPASAQRQRL
jgi:signal transduction histidine kinase